MASPPTAGRQATLARAAAALGLYVLAGGLISFLGWVLDLWYLTDWHRNGISIQPNSALCATFAGAGLLLSTLGYRRLAAAFAAVVILVGSATVFEWATGVDLGIDTLLMFGRQWGRVGVIWPGRMGPPGAMSWTLIGTAIVLSSVGGAGVRRAASALGLFVSAMASLSIIGYLIGVGQLYTVPYLTVIAFQTATFILAMALGLMASVPEHGLPALLVRDDAAGLTVRRVLLPIVVVPAILGWLGLLGHRAGLYDTAFGVAAFTIWVIVFLVAILWWTANAIARLEDARKIHLVEMMRAEEALREADRRKDEFLATLAHELRNPLAPIRNAVQALRLQATDDPDVRRAHEMIDRQLRHLVRLVDDLLDVGRITRGKLELQKERLDLQSVVAHAVETNRPLIEAAGHHLTLDLPPEPIVLDGDPVRLAQVFSNLLNNACKFTPKGGRIGLGTRREGGDVLVTVTDTGAGIPRDMLSPVFGLFVQVDRSVERASGGLGIGLHLVERLVELHGGTVQARSEGEGRGSEFLVRLRVAPGGSARQEEAQTEPAGEAPTPVRRILVVDDNRDSTESLSLLLQLGGHETEMAHEGEEAVEKARLWRPDVILLDLGLPEMNGYEACRAIRLLPGGKDIRIIALTGWGQEQDRLETTRAGFDAHLVKPVDTVALAKLLAAQRGSEPAQLRET